MKNQNLVLKENTKMYLFPRTDTRSYTLRNKSLNEYGYLPSNDVRWEVNTEWIVLFLSSFSIVYFRGLASIQSSKGKKLNDAENADHYHKNPLECTS